MRAEDETGYVEYVTVELPGLHRTAYVLCGDAHRADDIVQTTLITLYRHWRRAAAADNTNAYVRRMLVRTYLDERRRGWSRVRLTSEAPDRPTTPVSGLEQQDAVHDLLAGLPRAQRVVLTLRFACDMSVEEVAAVLGCSTGNVKSNTSRGLAALRDRLDVASARTEETA